MRKLVFIALIVAIVPWIVIGIVRENTDDDTADSYFVRAVFDNASTIVPGEDVKIAGVVVGEISAMDVTEDNKAAVTLRINDYDFTPFKEDATCRIGFQGLIGEKFVECEPGSTGSPPLERIQEGEGKGERLLPVARTSSPVDLDLINNIMRLPYRERFSILISEFGTALAGRGGELNEVIHRSNPALRETSEVIEILAEQNRDLARLVRNSDTVLKPLSRERESVAGFIDKAGATAEATAERRGELRRQIELLPEFLSELEPLMADLEGFAEQGTPVATDLRAAAPALGRLIEAQGTLATASRESFPSLGDALEVGRPAVLRARPLIEDLNRLGKQLNPLSVDLDDLLTSLDETKGLERLNDLVYYGGLATNGFDENGHYLRAGLVTGLCSTYATTTFAACNANFFASSAVNGDPLEPRNATAAKLARGGASAPPGSSILNDLLGTSTGSDPDVARAREENLDILRERARGDSPALEGSGEPVLDYLLGGEGQ